MLSFFFSISKPTLLMALIAFMLKAVASVPPEKVLTLSTL